MMHRASHAAAAMLLGALVAFATAGHERAPWLDPRQPVNERVESLLKQMTNAEKQAQTI
eukprot:SAG31_NODE_41277_length_277_cov_0.567416_1_plen_58_part_10